MIYNELGDGGQLNRVLQSRLNILGSAPSPALMPEIGPVLVLESERPEWSAYKNEVLWARRVVEAAGAAGTYTSLWIPPIAGQLLVITGIKRRVDDGRLEIGLAVDPGPSFNLPVSLSNIYSRDTFALGTSFSVQSGNSNSIPVFANGNDAQLAFLESAVGAEYNYPIVIRPTALNLGLLIRQTVDARPLDLNLVGYTRELLANER